MVGCLTSQQHARISQRRIYSGNRTCCHTETEVADQTCYLIQSQHTGTRPTSPSTDIITQASHSSTNFQVTGKTRPVKSPSGKGGLEPRSTALDVCTLPLGSLVKWLRRPPRERKIPGSNPACARIFPGSSHTGDLKIGTPVANLPGTWRYRVSAGTGWPCVSIL